MAAMNGHNLLVVEGLAVKKGAFRIANISFAVAEGESFILLGPTGSGKTLLLETIAGLHRPTAGRVLLAGEDVTLQPPEKRGIGFVYQDYALFPHLSVAENVAFGLALRERPRLRRFLPWGARRALRRFAADARVREMMRLLGIEKLATRAPLSLSGGERQRVALARALVIKPRLLLLDEPLSALDPNRRESLRRELKRLQRLLGLTVLHVTHDFEEALALGDRLGVLRAGRLEQVGTPDEVFRKPKTEFVAEFVGMRNIFTAEAEGAPNAAAVLHLPQGLDVFAVTDQRGRVRFAVRPEDVVVAPCAEAGSFARTSLRNCFCGRVVELEAGTALVFVTVAVPAENGEVHFVAAVTRRSWETLGFEVGSAVEIAFKASAVHVW